LDSTALTSSRRSPTLVRGCSGFVSMSSIGMNRPSASPNLSARDSTKCESWRIRASVGRPRLRLDTRENLLGKGVILGRAARARRESENRFAVGRTLFQADALGTRGFEELFAEDRADLVVDILRDNRSPVVERDQDPQESQGRVRPCLDLVDRLQEVVGALKREVRGLDRDQDVGRSD